ncbi:tRNA pseudouridine(38-40) synthase TruA [Luteolibacter ambystomatis]|uniref:tRNA pseudouridine synthase A n=1 Tax=Luteolibacter ambystomatis TaxID=2824561 RepID=A0A975G9Q5_9BACT|nr:tRNA pseudouridine(38-40) synthase TruA [Luteolibacter ambystomatis]QUE51386.1 tRNA pseudouridine(38-40) synthase TruA [Luteolibacter ambystomatis]
MSALKFKLTIAFDGSAYQGWQSQKSGRGVQDQVEAALARLFPSAPGVQGSSRTDAGVHALGMTAHFEVRRVEFRMPARHLVLAINACLPEDIRVLSAAKAPAEFNARFDTTGKQYRYEVWNHTVMNPLERARAWHVPRPLDLAAMREAAAHFVGRHDFRSFTANRGDVLEDAVRTLSRCEVRRTGARITFIIEGEGFLYKMCRGIVGTLVQIGYGKYPPAEVKEMLAREDRRVAGMNAPAHGLVLWKVFYPRTQVRSRP